MSGVVRPSGPLPPRVYWVRRLLAVAVVLALITAVWWIGGKIAGWAGEPADGADSASSGGAETPPSGAGQPAGGGQGQGRDDEQVGGSRGGKHGDKRGGENGGKRGDKRGDKQPLAAPSGPCAVTDVAMTVSAEGAPAGAGTPVTLRLTSLAEPACTLAITPDVLVLRITAGADVVWSSDDCPDELAAAEVVVRRQPATTYVFDWDGNASTDTCAAPGAVAPAGDYRAEAALVGADAHAGSFTLR